MTNHIREEWLEREGPGQGHSAKMSMEYIKEDTFAGYSGMVSHMCIRKLKCFHQRCHGMRV